MTTLWDKLDEVLEDEMQSLYNVALETKCSNFDELLHIIASHKKSDILNKITNLFESNGIDLNKNTHPIHPLE